MAAEIQTDRAGNLYIEEEMPNGEHVRVTLVGGSWAGESGIRFQIRDHSGHLRQGPEIPVSCVGDVISNIFKLSVKKSNA